MILTPMFQQTIPAAATERRRWLVGQGAGPGGSWGVGAGLAGGLPWLLARQPLRGEASAAVTPQE